MPTTPARQSLSDSSLGTSSNSDLNFDGLGPRERVLMSALKLFVEKGYFNTNIPDISKMSSCSVGSIYHHFLNKEEIASVLYLEGITLFRSFLSQAVDAKDGPKDTMRKVVYAFLEFAESRPLYTRYIWLARHDEFLSQSLARPTTVGFDSLGRKMTKVIKDAIREKHISTSSAEIIWSIVFGIPLSFITDWLEGYTRKKPTEVSKELAEAVVSALFIEN